MSILLFGISITYIYGEYVVCGQGEQKYELKAIHNFIKDYYGDWFPDIPKYESYVKRIGKLAESFELLAEILMSEQEINCDDMRYILDSMPIIVAKNSRSSSAKVAKDICNKGYCASKDMFYYGVKLHSLNQKQYRTLPKMAACCISPASVSDVKVAKEDLDNVRNIDVYADKIYNDKAWFSYMRNHHNNVTISAPVKLNKGQKVLDSIDRLYNSAVSSIHQSIESFFSWIQEKTKIQCASKVRSSSDLLSFICARIAFIFLF